MSHFNENGQLRMFDRDVDSNGLDILHKLKIENRRKFTRLETTSFVDGLSASSALDRAMDGRSSGTREAREAESAAELARNANSRKPS